jgi:hypothetical protein
MAASRPITTHDPAVDEATRERLLDDASTDTPVGELGLSSAAVSALERTGIGNAGQLLAMAVLDWNRTPGVGDRVRREVLDLLPRLRERLDVEIGPVGRSIDAVSASLVAKPTTAHASADQAPLSMLLGLGNTPTLTGDVTAMPAWPRRSDLRSRLDLDRDRVEALLQRARKRWAKNPEITAVRNDMAAAVERAGGVVSGDELAQTLLSLRGSVASGDDRLRRARAVVRAGLETEFTRESNRFTWRHVGQGSIVVALTNDQLDGEELANYAAALGAEADRMAVLDPLPSPTAVRDRLRTIVLPEGLPPLTDTRLVRLAAASSATASVSNRLELYPRGLSAKRAIQLARAALLGTGTLPDDEVRSRVKTRFPEAEPLPGRPQLDTVLRDTIGLEWFSGSTTPTGLQQPAGYRVPPPPRLSASTVYGSHTQVTPSAAPQDPEVVDARDVHERLRRHAANGGYLLMSVNPAKAAAATGHLRGLGATNVDVDTHLIGHLRAICGEQKINWDKAIVAADAEGPTGSNWAKLISVVRKAVERLHSELLREYEVVLLTNIGLLARYDQLQVLDKIRDQLRRAPEGDARLRTLWVLVPVDDPAALPTIAGKAIPVTTGAERLTLPAAWLTLAATLSKPSQATAIGVPQ